MKKLYFIRHGLSEGNVQEIWSGSTDTPLHTEGRAQAKAAGQKAKKLKIDLVVSSPMSRAKETAEIICDQIGYPKQKILFSDLLVERSFGDLDGTPHSVHDGTLELDSVLNVETKAMILERADKAIKFLESLKAHNILVVSHGSFGRAMRHHIVPDMPFANHKSSPQDRIPNAEIVQWI